MQNLFTAPTRETYTEERYDWYEAQSLKRASMAVSSENLTNWVDGSTLRQSFVYKVYTNGLRTQPRGAPVLLTSTGVFMSPTRTHCGRLLEKLK
ncbi:hypothetical protein NP493_474g01026 [Ridgeia piscesae]|uniref:Uncharacterized protein n=1 Tax=Ridgeia piscesae TaxID=27915 RepID=A0AAD9KY67_RIDPI|nr:hypothetical protein NP493_474g01026 [Ridgeia piscesae]